MVSLAISDGCMLNQPSLIHCRAPLTSVIEDGSTSTNSSSSSVAPSRCTEYLRQMR